MQSFHRAERLAPTSRAQNLTAMRYLKAILPLFATVFSLQLALAQAPDTLSFQGRLTNASGDPIDSSGVGMTFKLYKGGVEIWSESQSVDVTDGVFNVALGSVSSLDTVKFNQPIDLGIKLDNEGAEMAPWVALGASAFALGLRGLYAYYADQVPYTGYNIIGGYPLNSIPVNVVGVTISGGGVNDNGVEKPNIGRGHRVTISGGAGNTARGVGAVIGGGSDNETGSNASHSVIGGGSQNYAVETHGFIGGGNHDTTGGQYATVAGGLTNSAYGNYAAVAGGQSNRAAGPHSSIGGGNNNKASGENSHVGGGMNHLASGLKSVVGGGLGNVASNDYATVAGGFDGGASGASSTIGGGTSNTASAGSATVAGGNNNDAGGANSAIGGGTSNIATGLGATVPGGRLNEARGSYGFAAGYRAVAVHGGSFVWQDSTGGLSDTLGTTGGNQWIARASGGVTFYTTAAPDRTTGATLGPGLGAWASVSDVNAKTDFARPDPSAILERLSAVPIQTWRYRGEDPENVHIGPTAQDFYSAFGYGIDDKHIVTVDADGVALAAIQGLYELVKQQQAEIEKLRSMIEER